MDETDEIEILIPEGDWDRLEIGHILESDPGVKVIFSSPNFDIIHYMFGDKSEGSEGEKMVKVRISKIE